MFLFCSPVLRKPAFIHTHTTTYTKPNHQALNEENCLDVLQYADEFTLPNLSTVALAKIARCFDQLGLGEGAARAEERLPPHLLAQVGVDCVFRMGCVYRRQLMNARTKKQKQARAFHARIEALHADAEAAAAAAGGAGPGGAEEEAA